MISSSASLPSSPPSPSRSPFPKQKPASKDHNVIQSSRLHHWLPLPQVPKCTGRSSEPLLSRLFVCAGHTTRGGQKVLLPKEHNKVGLYPQEHSKVSLREYPTKEVARALVSLA